LQCEVLTMLAGPVAEMIYRGERLHPARVPAWQYDWHWAWHRLAPAVPGDRQRAALLELLLGWLHEHLSEDWCWAAIAAVSDELLAHEYLEAEQLAETLSFWAPD
jgi:hypothetical protein